MEREAYENMHKVESLHWWFAARRDIINKIISSLYLNQSAKILDVGCGTGGNLKLLAQFGEVLGVEKDPDAITFAEQKSIGNIIYGAFPNEFPKLEQKFDLITMLDVLEHLDDDEQALNLLKNYLNSDGYLLVTVPAFQFLWSQHDDRLHHKRRYKIQSLKRLATACGYQIEMASYFNFFLFPLAFFVRVLSKLGIIRDNSVGEKIPISMINFILFKVFSFEKYLLSVTELRFGLSIIMVLRPMTQERQQALSEGHRKCEAI